MNGFKIRNTKGDVESEFNIGTLCLIDNRARDLDDIQRTSLKDFAAMVRQELLSIADFSLAHLVAFKNVGTKASQPSASPLETKFR